MDTGTAGALIGVPWWSPVLGALVGAVVGAALGFWAGIWKDRAAKKARLKSCWSAVQSEMEICSDMAALYLMPPVVQAPSYRWPSIAYQHALPELLMNGGMSAEEAKKLVLFFINVDAVNRGLDLVQEANLHGDAVRAHNQFNVNVNRIEKHIHRDGDMYGPALAVIKQYCDQSVNDPQ